MKTQQSSGAPGTCPPWCVQSHGHAEGDDTRVHVGEPVYLSSGISARLCMSVDPVGHVEDGPFVLVGEEEYTLKEALSLGDALIAMAQLGVKEAGSEQPEAAEPDSGSSGALNSARGVGGGGREARGRSCDL